MERIGHSEKAKKGLLPFLSPWGALLYQGEALSRGQNTLPDRAWCHVRAVPAAPACCDFLGPSQGGPVSKWSTPLICCSDLNLHQGMDSFPSEVLFQIER